MLVLVLVSVLVLATILVSVQELESRPASGWGSVPASELAKETEKVSTLAQASVSVVSSVSAQARASVSEKVLELQSASGWASVPATDLAQASALALVTRRIHKRRCSHPHLVAWNSPADPPKERRPTCPRHYAPPQESPRRSQGSPFPERASSSVRRCRPETQAAAHHPEHPPRRCSQRRSNRGRRSSQA